MHIRHDEGPRDGLTVVLLHGQPGSASDWKRVVDALGSEPLRVVVVDRPGYGASEEPVSGWSGNARSILALLDREGIERAVPVGWSWSGGAVLELARLAPERIHRLVLIDSVGHRLSVGWADRLLAAPGLSRLMAPTMGRLGRHGVGLMAVTSGSPLDREAREFLTAEVALWSGTGAWRAAAYEQVAMVRDVDDLSTSLPSIDLPATVLHGRSDGYVSVAAAEALAAALPRAELMVVDGGHLLPIEHPAVVAGAITAAARSRAA